MNSIYDIEKSHLSSLQSSLDRLLNVISKLNRKFSEEELEDIILLNNDIRILENKINNFEINLIKKLPKRKITKNMKDRINTDNHANNVIQKFLPYMLAYSMNN